MRIEPAFGGVSHGRSAVVLAALLCGTFTPLHASVSYHFRAKVLGVPVHLVIVDLNDPNIRLSPIVSHRFPWGGESFGSMVRRTRPIAAINGTFFSPRSLRPVGDIIIEGVHVNRGRLPTALAILGGSAVSFGTMPPAAFAGMNGVRGLLACGPRLLWGGRVAIYAHAEGFKDRRVLGRAMRSVIGVTKRNKLILAVIARRVTLSEAAKIMKALGCVEAMNLDGGGSCGLYCGGKMLVRPTRALSSALLVFSSPFQHTRAQSQLLPLSLARWMVNEVESASAPSPFVRFARETSPSNANASASAPSSAPPRPATVSPPVERTDAQPQTSAVPSKDGVTTVRGIIVLQPSIRFKPHVNLATFIVDGVPKLITSVAPPRFVWDTTRYANGEHKVKIKVTGAQGETLFEEEWTYVVSN